MPKLWKKTIDTIDSANLQEIDLPSLVISTPTVILISGRDTRDDTPEFISKDIHFIKKILRDQPQLPTEPEVYTWSHGRKLATSFNIFSYLFFPQHRYRPSAKQLAQGALMPLVSEGGKPLPVAEVQKRLRNLTLFGYCAGSVFAQEVFNASLKMMQDIGYKPEEARALLHEVVLINIGTISRPTKEQDRFTTVSLANVDDRPVRLKNALLHPLRSAFFRADRKLKMESLSKTYLLVSAAARGRMRDRQPETREIEGVQLPRWNLTASNHLARDYVNNDDQHSQMSRIVSHALLNAVCRNAALTPQQLLEPPAALGAEEKALYLNRIMKAQGVEKKGKKILITSVRAQALLSA
jgi:hypothetical protein